MGIGEGCRVCVSEPCMFTFSGLLLSEKVTISLKNPPMK